MNGQPSSAELREQRVVRVFVSSTFRDMHAEREELIKRTFPQLRKLCEERGVTWGEVDLRWGITEEQSRRGEVVHICLAEIQRCRPYFIGLLGERYGWVPDEIPHELIDQEPWLAEHRHHSVTELEIVHGVLNDPKMADRALFYFRDRAFIDSLPPAEQPDYLELPTKEEIESFGQHEAERRVRERRQKLAALKGRIRASGLPVQEDYPDPQALGDLVLRDLTGVIDRLYPKGSEPDPLDREALDHEAFAQSRAKVYIGRQSYYDRLDEQARRDGPPLVVLGESGSGKSALLSNWALRYRSTYPEELLLMHFIGATPYSADWAAMLRRIMGELKRRFDIQQEIPDKPDELRTAFVNWLHMGAAKGRMVLILDALNHFGDRDGAPDLVWLPREIPPNIRLIVSTLPGRSLDDLTRRGWPTMQIEPLLVEERKQLIPAYLDQYAKQLSEARVERIVSTDQTANPLYLRALLDELRVFGIHEQLDARIDHYLLATTVEMLYERILERYEHDYERERTGLVGEAMSLLWAARLGLSETELLESLGTDQGSLPRAHWSPLFLAIEPSLMSQSGLINFGHDYLRHAVQNRYVYTYELQKTAHARLADYFERQAIGSRKLDEQPWQEAKALRWNDLRQTLANVRILEHAISEGKAVWHGERKYEWASYWRLVSARWQPGPCYEEMLSELANRQGEGRRVAALSSIIGDLLAEMALYQQAEPFLQRSFAIDYGRLGPGSGLATSLVNLAGLHKRQGNFSEALSLLRQALSFCEMDREPERVTLAAILNNLAQLHLSLGDYKQAYNLQLRALSVRRSIFGPRHPDVGTTLDNLGKTLQTLGEYEEAIANHREALAILEETLGPKNIDVATCLTNLGLACHAKGQCATAIPLYERALDIFESILGSAHPFVGTVLNNLGGANHEMKNYREAMALYSRAIEINERITGSNHSSISIALDNMAAVQLEVKNFDEALRLERRALEVAETMLGPGHPQTDKCRSNLRLLETARIHNNKQRWKFWHRP
ncbi:MAG: tetratricopeptide repeat protein [Acidobacteriota bacterium]